MTMTEEAKELDVKADDFDTALGSALADAAETAPTWNPGEEEKPEPILFEGRTVNRTEVKISGLTGLSEAYEGLKLGLDDRVRMVIEARVTKVNHYVDKDDQMVRSQETKVILADIVPWDPSNADDDGILRA